VLPLQSLGGFRPEFHLRSVRGALRILLIAASLAGLLLGAAESRGASAPIQLYHQWVGGQLILSWTNATLSLQFAPGMEDTFTNLPDAKSPYSSPLIGTQGYFRLVGVNPTAGMTLVPTSVFTMGNCMGPAEGGSDELPLHNVYVSAFYVDQCEVAKAWWDEVYTWALDHGYQFDHPGFGKGADHPVQTVNWYDALKWCNARSERVGLPPCYYTDAARTNIYKTGALNLSNACVDWLAVGYRLPTEAEWEKAARGGVSGHRFPWSDADTIQHARANYFSSGGYAYDTSPTRDFHPAFMTGDVPFTNPVGYFAPNNYGVYDMAGNVFELCWDAYSATYYQSAENYNPHGPSVSQDRWGVVRGGFWGVYSSYQRCANRSKVAAASATSEIGFRCVKSWQP